MTPSQVPAPPVAPSAEATRLLEVASRYLNDNLEAVTSIDEHPWADEFWQAVRDYRRAAPPVAPSELLPCPFCGCSARAVDRFNVKCEGCGAEINALPGQAIALWNWRAAPPVSAPASVAEKDGGA